MTPLKEMFSKAWVTRVADEICRQYSAFRRDAFIAACVAPFEGLELNQRMRHISVTLHEHLNLDFGSTLEIFRKIIGKLPRGYTNLVFPDYVAQYGLQHYELSMDALAYFTSFGSSEFAIRQFLRHDFDRTIKVMYKWSAGEDHHVRRLASEGSRPALPWSFKLQQVVHDPALTRPILEQLKADPELYVRKSVANHLNDISKFDPDYMLKLVGGWDNSNPRTAWIIRHASRTLVKKGHAGSLIALNFDKSPKIKVSPLRISPPEIRIGGNLSFEFTLTSQKKRSQRLAVDYRIHYVKKNGLSVKVFKLKEIDLAPGESCTLRKMQRFTDFSTRTHLPGKHLLEIQVNGQIVARRTFLLRS